MLRRSLPTGLLGSSFTTIPNAILPGPRESRTTHHQHALATTRTLEPWEEEEEMNCGFLLGKIFALRERENCGFLERCNELALCERENVSGVNVTSLSPRLLCLLCLRSCRGVVDVTALY